MLSSRITTPAIIVERGALLVNSARFSERSEMIREKGTNRRQFHRGHVNKYTRVEIGSSYLPGELIAAFLCAQGSYTRSVSNSKHSRI